jgi:hypothetical protein
MAELILLGLLGKDFGDGVFKYLDPRSHGERERHTYDNGVVQNESCYQLYT